jgi:hypothetical protein
MYSPTQPGTDTSSVGVANVQALTLFTAEPSTPPYPIEAQLEPGGSAATGDHPAGGNPVWIVLVGLALLVFLGWLRKQSSHLEGQTIALNAFNFVLMILTVMIGFVLVKMLFAKFPVPGLTQFVHAA